MSGKTLLDKGGFLGAAPGLLPDVAKVYPFGDFWTSVTLGLVPGVTRASGIGVNPDIDPGSTPEDAWGGSGLYPWLSAATSLEAVSTSASDSAAGTGARTVTFLTLDANFNSVPQTVTMSGLTPVPLPTQVIRNNGGRVMLCGSVGTNVGDIILRDAGGGNVRGIILAGIGVMRQAPYTVPAGFTLLVRQLLLAVDSAVGTVSQFASMSTWFKGQATGSIEPLLIGNTSGSPYPHFAEPPIMVAEKTDFALRINRVSDNNTIVTAGWNGALRKNS